MFGASIRLLKRVARDADRKLLGNLLLGAIYTYRVGLGWVFRGSCRFVPSCSAYAAEAVLRHGGCRGAVMTVGRIARCHPLHPGGFDPVP
ncbi:MAG: membrane protein insertion efficiency factor YidD [Acidobacteriota bacterium]